MAIDLYLEDDICALPNMFEENMVKLIGSGRTGSQLTKYCLYT